MDQQNIQPNPERIERIIQIDNLIAQYGAVPGNYFIYIIIEKRTCSFYQLFRMSRCFTLFIDLSEL